MTDLVTRYFAGEGRSSMEGCIHVAAEWCVSAGITTMVIFTGTGEGPHYAARHLLNDERYAHLSIVAVTPPVGRKYNSVLGDSSSKPVLAGIDPSMRQELDALSVKVVSAHLPFKERYDGKERTSEWARVAESFGVLGGGFALCIQSVMVACDAGLVEHGTQVVVLTADTAVEVRACRTEAFLSPIEGMLVGHIVCRPGHYNISKRLHETIATPPAPDATQVVDATGTAVQEPQLPAKTATPKRAKTAAPKRAKTAAKKSARSRR